MGAIETTYDMARDLTIITVTGKMTANDFHQWTASYYAGTTTSLNLWDLTSADLSNIRNDDLLEDTVRSKAFADMRKGGKTAVVASKDTLAFCLSRMREMLAEAEGMPFAFCTFHDRAEAQRWLGL